MSKTKDELELENHKSKLRQQAADKEITRLRDALDDQSNKVKSQKKAFFFIGFLFVFIIIGIVFIGIPVGKKQQEKLYLTKDSVRKKAFNDSLKMYRIKVQELIKHEYNRNESGYKFRVQIGAFQKLDLRTYEENLSSMSQEKYDSINQYTLGIFDDFHKAQKFLNEMKKMGFKDAFIFASYNGKRIRLENLPPKVKENIRKEKDKNNTLEE